jgi:hypothetical protein
LKKAGDMMATNDETQQPAGREARRTSERRDAPPVCFRAWFGGHFTMAQSLANALAPMSLFISAGHERNFHDGCIG